MHRLQNGMSTMENKQFKNTMINTMVDSSWSWNLSKKSRYPSTPDVHEKFWQPPHFHINPMYVKGSIINMTRISPRGNVVKCRNHFPKIFASVQVNLDPPRARVMYRIILWFSHMFSHLLMMFDGCSTWRLPGLCWLLMLLVTSTPEAATTRVTGWYLDGCCWVDGPSVCLRVEVRLANRKMKVGGRAEDLRSATGHKCRGWYFLTLPSGKGLHNYGQITMLFTGKSTKVRVQSWRRVNWGPGMPLYTGWQAIVAWLVIYIYI